jgi:hypothetical protein
VLAHGFPLPCRGLAPLRLDLPGFSLSGPFKPPQDQAGFFGICRTGSVSSTPRTRSFPCWKQNCKVFSLKAAPFVINVKKRKDDLRKFQDIAKLPPKNGDV